MMIKDGPKVRSDSEWEIVVIISGLNKKSINLNRSLSRINCRNKKIIQKGYLVNIMTRVKEQGKLLVEQESQTRIGRDAIINSIEARWNKWDQEILSVHTVLVNPFYRTAVTAPFAALPIFSRAYISGRHLPSFIIAFSLSNHLLNLLNMFMIF